MPWTATQDRLCLDRYLVFHEQRFDPARNLLTQRSTATYHSRLGGQMVHATRESCAYALALLDAHEAAWLPAAQAILKEVLKLQDTDPASETYGIWPYCAEEPLAAMSPPDWNWADFLGELLYAILARHAARLEPAIRQQAIDALRHAAASIRRRNVSLGYTNIAVLGTYVTVAAAEILEDEDLHAYALDRLDRFAAYTFDRGSFTEFNSPTYNLVTIGALTRLAAATADSGARRTTRRLLDLAWRHVLNHWHPPTMQWAGPHSRCYQTNLRQYGHAQLVLQKATSGRLQFFDDAHLPGDHDVAVTPYQDHATIPDSALHLAEPRTVVEEFAPATEHSAPVVGTTWLGSAATLGTANRLDLWNQRRAVLAYWGTPASGSSLQLQALHDGRDFASAQVFCAQHDGFALCLVNFANNGGDWHPSLDRIRDRRFTATDLRVRLCLQHVDGRLAGPAAIALGGGWTVPLDGTTLEVRPVAAAFGRETPQPRVERLPEGLGLDLVLFHRAGPTPLLWDEVGEAWAVFALRFGGPVPEVVVRREGPRVELLAQVEGVTCQVGALATVATVDEHQHAYRGTTTASA